MDLDTNLFPKDSPYTLNRKTVNSFDFNSNYDRNTVTTQKIRDFSFNNGFGGTLTLGGNDNGNGILRVLDSGGTQRVVFGNTGGTITNGNLVIENDSGGTTLDNKGVVSVTLLSSGAASKAAAYNQVVTGNSFQAVTDGTLTFTLERNAGVMFFAEASAYNANTVGVDAYFAIVLNGTTDYYAFASYTGTITGLSSLRNNFTHQQNFLSAGTNTFVFGVNPGAAGSLTIYNYQMSYLVIGD